MNVRLVEITDENRDAVCALRVHPSQKRFVESVARSLKDAAATPEAHPWYRAVYSDDEPVGFVMVSWNVPPGRPGIIGPYFLWRLLVDGRYQGRGVGRAALRQVVELVRADGATELLTSYVPGEGEPEPFYRGLGFRPTGEVDHGEIVLRLDLSGDAVSRYLDLVDETKRRDPEQRDGQAHLNALSQLLPTQGLIGTEFDPFNDDRRLPRFLDWVSRTLRRELRCAVCGRDAVPHPRDDGNRLLCGWCLAWTWLPHDGEPRKPEYRGIGERWAAATVAPTGQLRHAAVGNGSTLCGLPDAEALDYTWNPPAQAWRPCRECMTTAREVDARWVHGT